MTLRERLRLRLRHAGPAMSFAGWREALRAAAGALLGVGLLGLALPPLARGDVGLLMLIAPFGASAVLLFAAPNSPLAQPWSAVMGNVVSATVAVAVVKAAPTPWLAAALAPGLAILAMHLTRALHPPGGAVALTAALSPDMVQDLGFGFALAPVGLGTAAMALLAAGFAHATGRRYPFRQAAAVDAPTSARVGLSREELTEILQELRQSANIGVADLARLIAAAETRIALHHHEGVTAAEIMSRDLVTVGPETPLFAIAEIFRRHGFTSLPVVGPEGRYLGLIFQIHLIRRGDDEARRSRRSFVGAMARLLDRERDSPPRAREIMSVSTPHVAPQTPLSALLPHLAMGDCDALPVLEGETIVGVVTRTDLAAALARGAGASSGRPSA